jgi:putative transposase
VGFCITLRKFAEARLPQYNNSMTQRNISFTEGEFYHVYNRGNSKQKIFLDNYDYDRFTKLLYLCNSEKSIDFREDIIRRGINAWDFDRGESIISIGAWVLMPNHFHIYLTINSRKQGLRKFRKLSDNKITDFMHKLLTSHSKYFNAKYKRTGALFEGKFKSVHIENDNQAKYLFSYIHLNPVKLIDNKWKENGLKNKREAGDFLKKYLWSSYLDYKGVIRSQNKIVNKKAFPKYFQKIKDFDSEIEDWLAYSDVN